MAFSQRQMVSPEVLDLRTVILAVEPMLRRLIRENVELVVTMPPEMRCVRADPGQLEQVIINLAINGRDAMLEGGRLSITAEDTEVDESLAANLPGLAPGPHVRLTVRDTGTGMTPEIVGRIFEPFFTTKEAGRGTGLGLASVYGIVRQSDGAIAVDSTPGKGSTFSIYLPAVDSRPAEAWAAQSEPVLRGSETILFVEDNAALLAVARRILQMAGYTVLTAADGTEALKLLRDYTGPLDLVLTDVVMPGIGGRELAAEIAAGRPHLKVLFASGYSDDAALREDVLDGAAAFIGKPYSVDDLARKVRQVLDG